MKIPPNPNATQPLVSDKEIAPKEENAQIKKVAQEKKIIKQEQGVVKPNA